MSTDCATGMRQEEAKKQNDPMQVATEAINLVERLKVEIQAQKTKKRFYKAKVKALLAAQQFKRLQWLDAHDKMAEDVYSTLVTAADERRFKRMLSQEKTSQAKQPVVSPKTQVQKPAQKPVEISPKVKKPRVDDTIKKIEVRPK